MRFARMLFDIVVLVGVTFYLSFALLGCSPAQVAGPGFGNNIAENPPATPGDMAVAHARPVVIAESSPAFYNLADPVEASRAWNEWFTPYFALIESRTEIKWFHYINYDWYQASYYANSGWKNNDISTSASLAALYITEVSTPKYLHAGEKFLLKDFDKYK